MATRAQIEKLAGQIDKLQAMLIPQRPLDVAMVYEGETDEEALAHHDAQHPGQAPAKLRVLVRRFEGTRSA